MTDTANMPSRTLFDVLMAQGLLDAVLSPGSRNAPLLIAASARPELNARVIPDERTAAFTALGIALASRRPVMLACTSGTALYNYAPAVAEAFYQHVPLIVVTADRPERWIDQDDSQTLRQPGALANIVKKSFNIPATEGASTATRGSLFGNEQEWYVNRLANEAWITATSGIPGPVHINIQLDNPLGELTEATAWKSQRIVSVVKAPGRLTPETLRALALKLWDRKVLVVAGFMAPDHKLNQALEEFASLPNVAVCAEPLSNLHFQESERASMIDLLLSNASRELKNELRPDVVISIGGSLVSRMLKEFVREYQPEELWTLGDTEAGVDCFQSITTHFEAEPAGFFRGLASLTRWAERKGRTEGSQSRYAEVWSAARKSAKENYDIYRESAPWSDFSALMTLFDRIPNNYNVFCSNGTPVRYMGLSTSSLPHGCFCNRGVSGIEGGNATAAGGALAYPGPTILISGDMSFSYNPQILGLPGLPDNFRIVVINNGGGGIFRFIRTTRDLPQREEYFCADRPQPLREIARAYGWSYLRAGNDVELQAALHSLFEKHEPNCTSGNRIILEIVTDPEVSARTLRNLLSPDKKETR